MASSNRSVVFLGFAATFAISCANGGETDGGPGADTGRTDSGSSDGTPGDFGSDGALDTAVSDSTADGAADTAVDDTAVDDGFKPDVLPSDTSGSGGCAEDTKRVFVVSKSKELHRFDPATLTFTKIGPLTCPAGAATPFSMAVDRSGTAWILYNDGRIFLASTRDATCVASKYVADQEGFKTFGMAFVTDAPGSTSETIFVAETDKALGKINPTTLVLTPVGGYGKTSVPAELTGRGDGRLFAFFQRTPFSTGGPRISELDPKTGKILTEKNPPSVNVGSGWAFAQWGGSYWLFTAPSSANSIVTEYNYETGVATDVVADVGFKIVGAGASTCAPTVRIK